MPTQTGDQSPLSILSGLERGELVRWEMPLDHQLYEIAKPVRLDRVQLDGEVAEGSRVVAPCVAKRISCVLHVKPPHAAGANRSPTQPRDDLGDSATGLREDCSCRRAQYSGARTANSGPGRLSQRGGSRRHGS